MSYSGGFDNKCNNISPVGSCFTSAGVILVLFILLVIVSCSVFC
ncbi:YjcZ family sporulation protein [Paenibacillus plantiphilus]